MCIAIAGGLVAVVTFSSKDFKCTYMQLRALPELRAIDRYFQSDIFVRLVFMGLLRGKRIQDAIKFGT